MPRGRDRNRQKAPASALAILQARLTLRIRAHVSAGNDEQSDVRGDAGAAGTARLAVIIYGRNPVREAMRGPRTVAQVWATKNAAREEWVGGAGGRVVVAASEEIERRCG